MRVLDKHWCWFGSDLGLWFSAGPARQSNGAEGRGARPRRDRLFVVFVASLLLWARGLFMRGFYF